MPFRLLSAKFGDISLRWKLFSSLLLLVIAPLIAASLVITFQMSEIIKTKSNETSLQILKQTKEAIANVLVETDYLSISMLADDRIQRLSKNPSQQSNLEAASAKRELYVSVQTAIQAKPYINSISVSKGNEIIFQFGDLVDAEDQSLFDKALELKGKGYWTSTYPLGHRIAGHADEYVISYIRVINDLDGYDRPIAFQRISLSENYLSEIYSGIHTWNEGSIMIIDSAGRVVSSPDKRLLGQHIVKEQPDFARILSGGEGYFDSRIHRTNHSVLYYTIDQTDWHVVQTIPVNNFMTQAIGANLIIIGAIAVCLLFGLIFSIILTRTVVKPLNRMSKVMRRVREGNFNIEYQVRTRDEIGHLGLLFTDMVLQIKHLIDTVYKSQIKEKEAEFMALEAQINPHFLYNSLDSIRWLAVKNKDYDVSDQIEALSDIFRHSLNRGKSSTTIGEEIEYLNSYLLIQKSRFDDRLNVTIEVENELLSYQTLKLILQPLVENAVQHGLESKRGSGEIVVRIEKKSDQIRFTVTDNGVGTDERRIESMLASEADPHRVYALKNINDRIRLRYGEPYGLKLYSEPGQWTRVEVVIPAIRNDWGRSENDETADR